MSNKSAPATADKNDTKDATAETNATETNYVKEIAKDANEHIALIAFCSTALIGFLNLCVYAYELGKCKYWGIDISNIDISKGNILYSLLLYIAITVIMISLNYVVYSLAMAKRHKIMSYIFCAIIIILVTVAFAFIVFIPVITDADVKILDALRVEGILGTITLYSFLLSILSLSFGLSFALTHFLIFLKNKAAAWFKKQKSKRAMRKKNKQNKNKQKTKQPKETKNSTEHSTKNSKYLTTAFLALIILSLCAVSCCVFGYTWAEDVKDSRAYKIIETTQQDEKAQVVLYEGADFFIVSDCEINDNDTTLLIYINKQTRIEKNNVSTILKRFAFVDPD